MVAKFAQDVCDIANEVSALESQGYELITCRLIVCVGLGRDFDELLNEEDNILDLTELTLIDATSHLRAVKQQAFDLKVDRDTFIALLHSNCVESTHSLT